MKMAMRSAWERYPVEDPGTWWFWCRKAPAMEAESASGHGVGRWVILGRANLVGVAID